MINHDNRILMNRIVLKPLLKDKESPRWAFDNLVFCDRVIILSEMVGAAVA